VTSPLVSVRQNVLVTVRVEGDRVLLLADGQLVLGLPFEAAAEIGQAMVRKALEAKLASDTAVLGPRGLQRKLLGS